MEQIFVRLKLVRLNGGGAETLCLPLNRLFTGKESMKGKESPFPLLLNSWHAQSQLAGNKHGIHSRARKHPETYFIAI